MSAWANPRANGITLKMSFVSNPPEDIFTTNENKIKHMAVTAEISLE